MYHKVNFVKQYYKYTMILQPMVLISEEIKLYKRLTRTQVAPETIENDRYKNRRLLALYFDMSAMGPADQMRALLIERYPGVEFLQWPGGLVASVFANGYIAPMVVA